MVRDGTRDIVENRRESIERDDMLAARELTAAFAKFSLESDGAAKHLHLG
jgi:hypothetical protein